MTFLQDITYTFTEDTNDLRILKSELTERVRLHPGGVDRTLSGIHVGDPKRGRLLFVMNIGSHNIEFLNQDSGSELENRFAFTEILTSGAMFLLWYEPADRRWKIVTGSTTIAGGGEANTTSNQGGGVELALPKSGVDLPFRTLAGEDGVSVATDGDLVVISGDELQDQITEIVEDIDVIEEDIADIYSATFVAGAGMTGGGVLSSSPIIFNIVASDPTIIVDPDGIRADLSGLDHGDLGGLADDDHTQYVLAELSSVDNQLVRWDGTTGRAVQSSAGVLSDAGALTGLASVAASSFVSIGGTVATTGHLRGDSTFTLQARNAGNSANVPLMSWASDDVTFGDTGYDTNIVGLTIDIGIFRWPSADGLSGYVVTTNGSGVLSLVAPSAVFDHGDLSGLSDDDHLQYMLAESSSTDNRLVRWDGTDGRQVQTSGATLSDSDALTGLLSAAASSFVSIGGTVATAGNLRGDSAFTLQARDAGNTANVPLVSWASDDVTYGHASYDTNILGLTIDIGPLRWPTADGSANAVMTTNGSGVLSLVAVTSLFDHGTLGGLSDDDHSQYLLSEPSSTDNQLVRWDGTTGRAVQSSAGVLSDAGALTGLASVAASSFVSIGGTVATAGSLRGDSAFTLQVRNAGNSADVALLSWASDDVAFGSTSHDTDLRGLTIDIGPLRWPTADGAANAVMTTNGSGVLSLVAVTTLFDHGTLGGLSDDDHSQYLLSEPSSTDNQLVRWDGASGRAVQSSAGVLSDGGALTGLDSVAVGTFVSAGGTVATQGAIRGDSSFTVRARNVANSSNIALFQWASDDLAVGSSSHDLDLLGLTIDIGPLRWPTADGVANAVMKTNGSGVLALVDVTTLFDHGTLSGLSDDDHSQYLLSEPSSTDNQLVRWDGTTGRAVQSSAGVLSDGGALTGLASVAASSFVSVGGTVATAGNLRGDSAFTLQLRDVANSTNVPVVSWAADDISFGNSSYDTNIFGLTIDIGPLRWPTADGSANQVMITNGSAVLSFASATSLFDHGTLGGLSDDDHSQYMLAEPSSTDNRLVRWDGAGGRSVQTSGVTLNDSEAMSGLASVDASGFFSVGGTVATVGSVRGDSTFTLQARNLGNLDDIVLVSLNTDTATFGDTAYDSLLRGAIVQINGHTWPGSDGTANQLMRTNGSGQLSFVTVTSLFDHGTLGGLSDDDHSQYMLAEPSSTDNQLVRWDGTTGRAVQSSAGVLSDGGALTGLASVTASGFFAAGSTPATVGAVRGPFDFTLRVRDAANSANLTILSVVSDTTVLGDTGESVTIQGTELDITAPTTDFNTNSITNVDDLTLRSTTPTLDFIDTDSTSNGKHWRLSTGSDDLVFSLRDDATGAHLQDALAFRRTNGALDFVEMDEAYVVTNRTDTVGVTSTALSSGTNNNFSLASTTTHLRLTSGAFAAELAGLTGGTQGRKVYVTNVDTDSDVIVVKNEASTSTAANRILTPDGQDFTFAPGSTIVLFYDGVSSRWRVVAPDGAKWRMRGVLQTTGSSATEFFSIAMPTNFVFFVDVWVVSRREEVGPEDESAHALSHFEIAYKRYASGDAIAGADDGAGQDTNQDVRPRTVTKLIEYNHGHVRLVGTNSGTAVSLQVDPASAVTWRHNWVVEILAVPMDYYV